MFACVIASHGIVHAESAIDEDERIEELERKIQTLKDQYNAIRSVLFTHDLNLGVEGIDVANLQTFLQGEKLLALPKHLPKGYFGDLTQSALVKYQLLQGIDPATGFFGPLTRKRVNSLLALRVMRAHTSSGVTLSPRQTLQDLPVDASEEESADEDDSSGGGGSGDDEADPVPDEGSANDGGGGSGDPDPGTDTGSDPDTDTESPSVPSGLIATAISSQSIILSWVPSTDNTGVYGYNVYRDGLYIGAVTDNMYTDTGLQQNTTYIYTVAAFDADANLSAQSSSATETTPAEVVAQPETPSVPYGIYFLGDTAGTSATNNPMLGQIDDANKSFIDGFTWRTNWDFLDAGDTAPNYDFEDLDAAVGQLQAMGKKLTLEVFVQSMPPYVLDLADETFTATINSSRQVVTAVPWDQDVLAKYREFVHALATHQVLDTNTAQMVAFKDHPVLAQVNAGILGLQSIRDIGGTVSGLASYTRPKFIQAVLDSINAVTDEFPDKHVFIGYFSMTDGNGSIDSELISTLDNEFDGVNDTRIGFFQENLRGNSPTATNGLGLNLVTWKNLGGYVMFQACGSWLNHNPCTFAAGDDSPENGFNNGSDNYDAKYYELYSSDLNNTAWESMFDTWHDLLDDV